jgi:hypothetical protein
MPFPNFFSFICPYREMWATQVGFWWKKNSLWSSFFKKGNFFEADVLYLEKEAASVSFFNF